MIIIIDNSQEKLKESEIINLRRYCGHTQRHNPKMIVHEAGVWVLHKDAQRIIDQLQKKNDALSKICAEFAQFFIEFGTKS